MYPCFHWPKVVGQLSAILRVPRYALHWTSTETVTLIHFRMFLDRPVGRLADELPYKHLHKENLLSNKINQHFHRHLSFLSFFVHIDYNQNRTMEHEAIKTDVDQNWAHYPSHWRGENIPDCTRMVASLTPLLSWILAESSKERRSSRNISLEQRVSKRKGSRNGMELRTSSHMRGEDYSHLI